MPKTKKAPKPVKFIATLYYVVLGSAEFSDMIRWTDSV